MAVAKCAIGGAMGMAARQSENGAAGSAVRPHAIGLPKHPLPVRGGQAFQVRQPIGFVGALMGNDQAWNSSKALFDVQVVEQIPQDGFGIASQRKVYARNGGDVLGKLGRVLAAESGFDMGKMSLDDVENGGGLAEAEAGSVHHHHARFGKAFDGLDQLRLEIVKEPAIHQFAEMPGMIDQIGPQAKEVPRGGKKMGVPVGRLA